MKNVLLLAILLSCATGAMAQTYGYVLSNEPQILIIPDHPGHAQRQPMAKQQNLYGEESPYTYAQGEVPLREFVHASAPAPLGDIAREVREERAGAKRARIIWND
jgi:hypothetical protein